MKRAYVLIAVLGLLAGSASAAEYNMTAYTGHYTSAPGGGTLSGLAVVPLGPNGHQRVEVTPGVATTIEIILQISTEGTEGISGGDFSNPGTNDPFGNPFPSGFYSGDPGSPDIYLTIGQLDNFLPQQIDEQEDADIWDPIDPAYFADFDTWFFLPFTSQLGSGYIEGPNDEWYTASAVAPDLGNCLPDYGSNGVDVPFMHLVLSVDAMPAGELTHLSVAGLGGLCSGRRPSTWMWLGQLFDNLDPTNDEVPVGRIEVFAIPEPATLALMAMGILPVITRRRG